MILENLYAIRDSTRRQISTACAQSRLQSAVFCPPGRPALSTRAQEEGATSGTASRPAELRKLP